MQIKSFFSFLDSIKDSECKSKFLQALSDDEKLEFVASKEDYRMCFYSDPYGDDDKYPSSKPELQVDASDKSFDIDAIQKRFKEFKESFPEIKSIEALRKKVDPPLESSEEYPDSPKSISELRKKAGVTIAVDLK